MLRSQLGEYDDLLAVRRSQSESRDADAARLQKTVDGQEREVAYYKQNIDTLQSSIDTLVSQEAQLKSAILKAKTGMRDI